MMQQLARRLTLPDVTIGLGSMIGAGIFAAFAPAAAAAGTGLFVGLLVYAVVAVSLVAVLGIDGIATPAPLAVAAEATGWAGPGAHCWLPRCRGARS